MATILGKTNLFGIEANIASTAYFTCSTGASTAAKVANLIDSSETLSVLFPGMTIHVKFTEANSASNPTLTIGDTGAKAIMRYGTTAASTSAKTSWRAGAVVPLTYDGTNWIINSSIDDNSDSKASSGNTSSKIFLVGATTQSTSGQTTYSHDTAYVGTDGCLYSNSKKVITTTELSLTDDDFTTILANSK